MAPSGRKSAAKGETKKREKSGQKPFTASASPGASSTVLTLSKTQTFFIERLYNIPSKLDLSDITKAILKEYDDVQLGKVDEADFCRKLYLSAGLRAALNDTIIRCTEIMSESPEDTGLCVAMIKKCSELIKLSSKPLEERHFPFRKLPSELRNRIYKLSFGTSNCIRYESLHHKIPIAAWCPSGSCPSSDYGSPPHLKLDLAIALTCKAISEEVLPLLYSGKTLSFSCTCKMLYCLRSEVVRDNIRSVSFHWRGSKAEVSIPLLMKCPNLDELFVKISTSTTHNVTKREEKMQNYFRANQKPVRLSDACGIEELMQIRGIAKFGVHVSNAPMRSSGKRTEDEVFSMQRLLSDELCKPKPKYYGEDVKVQEDDR